MNIRNEIYKAIKEGLPITLPNQAQQERNGETYVLVTDLAPDNVKELAGDSRQAFIVSEEPLKISFPNSETVVDVSPDAIVKESVDTESVVQTKTVSGRKIQIKKIGSGPAHKVYVEEDPALEFPSADAAKSWLDDYEKAGGHFTYESKQVRNYVKNYLGYIGGTNLNEEVLPAWAKGLVFKKKRVEKIEPSGDDWEEGPSKIVHYVILDKSGKQVGNAKIDDYFMKIYGELYGKSLPDVGEYYNSRPSGKKNKSSIFGNPKNQFDAFLKSKTGVKWSKNLKIR
jgi:hypothetical protein